VSMTTITLTRHEFNPSQLCGLAGKEHRPWVRRRIKAIALEYEDSMSREEIAQKLGTDSDQIRLWIARYNREGLRGLEDAAGRGRKRTITIRQEASLHKAMQHSPRKSGVATNLWTGRAVQEYLTRRQWFSCSIPEAYIIIHRLGFTLQRPGRTPTEANPKQERQFLKELRGKKRTMSPRRILGGG
jgi:transposase